MKGLNLATQLVSWQWREELALPTYSLFSDDQWRRRSQADQRRWFVWIPDLKSNPNNKKSNILYVESTTLAELCNVSPYNIYPYILHSTCPALRQPDFLSSAAPEILQSLTRHVIISVGLCASVLKDAVFPHARAHTEAFTLGNLDSLKHFCWLTESKSMWNYEFSSVPFTLSPIGVKIH